jgi:ornithine cyclodeaminase/alanine dehydrogenase-like protein (mu-crystallin family)
MRLISRKDVENSLPMRAAVEVMRQAFIELSSGTAIVPPRIHLSIEKRLGTTLVMPAYLSETDALASKIVSVFPGNAAKNLPVIQGLVILFDEESGAALAVIEGSSLTALRTGAASGLATDLLARHDASTLAVFGTGAQSRTQIEAVCSVRNIDQIFVFGRRSEQAERFIGEMRQSVEAEFVLADSPRKAVAGARIICAATTSEIPVFDGHDLSAGTHINGVGSFKPSMQEIDLATLQRVSKIVVDSRQNALTEAGDLVQAIGQKVISAGDIYAEIGEIAAGHKPGRENETEITFFKSVGNAVQDAAIAKAIYRISVQRNLGSDFDLND